MRLIERRLGRERAVGLADVDEQGKPIVVVDPTQPSRERLDTIIHEALHHIEPSWTERRVSAEARKISRLLWRDGWRRVEK